jgi:hypothetical protein
MTLFEKLLIAAALILYSAAVFSVGYRTMRRDMQQFWFAYRCPGCGALPTPRIIHMSGCESGWPNPTEVRLPGEGG